MDVMFRVVCAQPETAKDRFIKKAPINIYTKKWHDYLLLINGNATVDQLIASGIPEGWYREYCSCCGKHVEKVIVFDVNSGEYDYGVCKDCLSSALSAIGE